MFRLVQGQRAGSCEAPHPPQGSVVALDLLALVNPCSSHFRSSRGRRLPAQPPLAANRHAPGCLASFALRQPQLPRELVRRNLCSRLSFPNLWAHTPAQRSDHDNTPAPTPTPTLCKRPETSVCCCAANEQESFGGNFRVKF